MMIFDLDCGGCGHRFESTFASSAEHDRLRGLGLLVCPSCGGTEVSKAPMAPAVARKGSQSPLADLQARLLEGSRWVGDDFAEAARAIHAGDAEPEKLHGRTSLGEASKLVEEGVPVLPLPFPLVPPGEVN